MLVLAECFGRHNSVSFDYAVTKRPEIKNLRQVSRIYVVAEASVSLL